MSAQTTTAATEIAGDSHMLSEHVYRSILQLISRGQLDHGSALRIEELSKSLNVSPTPVREGLARLESTGLVVHLPRRGFRVAPPLTTEQFDKLMDARELLEVGAAESASLLLGSDLAARLEPALTAQRAAVARFHTGPTTTEADFDLSWSVIEADLAFHHALFEATGNSFIQLLTDTLNGQSHRVRQSAERGISDDLEALHEHTDVVDAARTGDPALVADAMRRHLELVRSRARNDLAGA